MHARIHTQQSQVSNIVESFNSLSFFLSLLRVFFPSNFPFSLSKWNAMHCVLDIEVIMCRWFDFRIILTTSVHHVIDVSFFTVIVFRFHLIGAQHVVRAYFLSVRCSHLTGKRFWCEMTEIERNYHFQIVSFLFLFVDHNSFIPCAPCVRCHQQ